MVCSSCGFVVRDRAMDLGPEWRSFNQEQWEGRCRVGPPSTPAIHDKGLSTTIDWRNRDSQGKSLTPKRRAQVYRLRKWQHRIRISNAAERSLAFAFSEIYRMSSSLSLPQNVREIAAVIYRRAAKKQLIRGRSVEGVAAAALYTACREYGIPRTFDEIANASQVGKEKIRRSYRYITRKLRIRLRPANPADYIPRFGSKLGLSGETQAKAIALIEKIKIKKIMLGRSPIVIAAAALYVAGRLMEEYRTEGGAADAADITEVSLRTGKNELCRGLGIELPRIPKRAG